MKLKVYFSGLILMFLFITDYTDLYFTTNELQINTDMQQIKTGGVGFAVFLKINIVLGLCIGQHYEALKRIV